MKRNLLLSMLIFLMALQMHMIPTAEATTSTDTTQPAAQSTQPPVETQSPAVTQPTTPAAQPTTPATQPATQPTTPATQPTTPATQPTTPATQPTTAPTQPSTESTTAPTTNCSHTYGAWNASEAAHSKTCTKCGHTETAGHTWYSEIVTVLPTCKEAGGKAQICTTCEFILITEITPPLTTHTYTNTCDTECNVCGFKREVTHSYSTVWQKNGKGHWHPCSICGAAGELKSHYPGPAATEEKEQTCLTCGYVLMGKRNHEHKYNKEWTSDEFGHWYSCSGCSTQTEYAVHAYEDSCDTDCGICGYTRTAPHTYGTDWQQTETTHCGVCTVCGEQGAPEEHVPDTAGTCCSICGYVITAAEENHVHSFDASVWGFDDAGHWHNCSCGEKQMAQSHNWDGGRELTKNMITYTCQTCGAQRVEEAAQGGFPWLLVLIIVVMAAAVAGIVFCVILLKKQGKYSQ